MPHKKTSPTKVAKLQELWKVCLFIQYLFHGFNNIIAVG